MLESVKLQNEQNLPSILNAWQSKFYVMNADGQVWSDHAEDIHSAIAKWLQHCVESEIGGDRMQSKISALVCVSLTGLPKSWAHISIAQAVRLLNDRLKTSVRLIIEAKYPALAAVAFLENADYKYGNGLTYSADANS